MRISASDIKMESARSYHAYMESSTSTVVMVGTKGLLSDSQKDGDMENNILVGEELKQKNDGESSFEEKMKNLKEKLDEMSSNSKLGRLKKIKEKRDSLSTVRESCLQYLIKIFWGEQDKWSPIPYDALQPVTGQKLLETVYCQTETYFEESEQTSFHASGMVQTADGRQIPLQLNVGMSRSFSAYYQENFAFVQERMRDPLVINLDGNVAKLSDQTFFFDLDGDGEKEEISRLEKGSGYLALDKNGDGVINDGSELFGTKSGDGFRDLAAYDSDGNGWIDENDEIWEKLLIWTRDEDGKEICHKLSEKGVGAIYTGNVNTDFSLNGADNAANGRIRRTGLFLYENGMAGTVQHVDVAERENGVGHFEAAR